MVSRVLLFLTICGPLCGAEDLAGQARQAQARGDYRSAAEAWRKIVATDPDNPEARSNFGVVLQLAGQDTEALQQLRLALRQKPGLVAANLFAGIALVKLGRPREAIDYLERARAADGPGVAPRLALGRAYVALREFDKANRSYREAAERDPRSTDAWFGAGITYRNLADSELRKTGGLETGETRQLLAQALEALMRAVELDPGSERVHLMLAESLGDSGRFLDSVQEYGKALGLHPDSVAANLGLATVHWKSGETESALPPLRRVLELSPKDPEANGIMADILTRQGDYDAAIRHAKMALAGNPELPHVRTALAKAYLAEKRADLAVPELEKAAPYDVTGHSHFLLYQAFKQLGREEDAKAALVKFKQLRGLPVYP
ncbi:MAG: tetratricopeptide repeat protein [Bryobacteraceae bacterium]